MASTALTVMPTLTFLKLRHATAGSANQVNCRHTVPKIDRVINPRNRKRNQRRVMTTPGAKNDSTDLITPVRRPLAAAAPAPAPRAFAPRRRRGPCGGRFPHVKAPEGCAG